MKKALKLYFLVVFSLLLISVFNLARAETTTPIAFYKAVGSSFNFTSPQQLCASMVALGEWAHTTVPDNGAIWCYSRHYNQNYNLGNRIFNCPDSTWTLQGNICWRPDCPAGEERVGASCVPKCPEGSPRSSISGLCLTPCKSHEERKPDDTCGCRTGWANAGTPQFIDIVLAEGQETPANPCIEGCEFSSSFSLRSGNNWYADVGRTTGQSCSSGPNSSAGALDQIKNGEIKEPSPQSPKCSENVVTRSTGEIVCVPSVVPQSRKPETTIKTKTEINEQGQQKQTEIVSTRDPVTGALSVQTVVTGPGGQSTSSESESSEGKKSGEGDCSGEDCTEGGNDPLGPKGSFGDASGEIEAAKGRLTAEWSQIKEQASGMFTAPSTGSGSLPCPPPVNVLGANFSLCLSDYSDQLAVIGLAFIAACYVVAAMVLLRS